MNRKIIPITNHIHENNDNRLTWGEFKQRVEAAGIEDSDNIDSIDVSWGQPEELKCIKDDIFGWQIKL